MITLASKQQLLLIFDQLYINIQAINKQIMKQNCTQVDFVLQQSIQQNLCDKQHDISNSAQDYNSHMSALLQNIAEKDQQLLTAFKEARIIFKKDKFYTQFQAKVKQSTTNKEVVVFNLKWGYFEIHAYVLHVQGMSKIHKSEVIASHLSSDIYEATRDNHLQVIKCMKNLRYKSRIDVFKEWFLTKIGSALGFGPKLSKQMHFDIIFYDDCSQFAIQQCTRSSITDYSMIQDLFYKLALMHRFKIVHQDIKPENIMFSKKTKRFLLIDFGLSRIIQEQIGFKTVSNFVGSASFCSPAMLSCFYNKQRLPIDLYFNDFYSLNHSIREMINQQSFQQNNSDNEGQALIFPCYEPIDFDWVHLFQARYLLFNEKISQIQILWPKIVRAKLVSQVLVFLKQLTPNQQLREFFNAFISDSEAQTIIYTQLMRVYKNSNEHIFCPIFGTDFQKLARFQKFYDQTQAQLIGLVFDNKKKAEWVRKLVNDGQQIRKVTYIQYLKAYLQFISYTNNIHGVTVKQREEAALVYISEIICKDAQYGQIIGPEFRLVNYTIQHILTTVLLKTKDSLEDFCEKSMILLELYDFMVVLGLGFIDQFLLWLKAIFEFIKLIPKLREIFIKKVSWSLLFISKRIVNAGKNISIREIIDGIHSWQRQVTSAMYQTDKKYVDTIQKVEEVIQRMQQNQQTFDIEWLSDSQLCRVMKILKRQTDRFSQYLDPIEETYLRFKNKTQFKRFYYFLIDIYDKYFSTLNRECSKNIYNIIRQNFNDQSILKEFTLHFQINTINKLMICQSQQQYHLILQQMNHFYLPFSNRDILVHSTPIYIAYNSLLIFKQYQVQQNIQIFKEKECLFILKFVQELTDFLNFKIIDNLSCFYVQLVLQAFSMIHAIDASLIRDFISHFQQGFYQISCEQCSCVITFTIKLYQLHLVLLKISESLMKDKQKSSEGLLDQYQPMAQNFYHYYQAINRELQSKAQIFKHTKSIQLTNHYYSLLFCCNHPVFQQMYHGIYNFFKYTSENRLMHVYLQSQVQYFHYVRKTFQVLENQSQQQYFKFLYEITDVAKQKPYQKYVHPIYHFYYQHMYHRTEAEKIMAFYNLKAYVRRQLNNNAYISAIFNVLLNLVDDFTVKINIMYVIAKLIDQSLTPSIKNLLLVNLYYFSWKSITDTSRQSSRKRSFCNKKIVKNWMHRQGSQSFKKKVKKAVCKKRQAIFSKLSNFEKTSIAETSEIFYYCFQ